MYKIEMKDFEIGYIKVIKYLGKQKWLCACKSPFHSEIVFVEILGSNLRKIIQQNLAVVFKKLKKKKVGHSF